MLPDFPPLRSSKVSAPAYKAFKPPVRTVVLIKQEPISDEDLSVSSENEIDAPYSFQRMINIMPLRKVKSFFHRHSMNHVMAIPVSKKCACRVYADNKVACLSLLNNDYTSLLLGKSWNIHVRYQYIFETNGINAYEGNNFWMSYQWVQGGKHNLYVIKENHFTLAHNSGFAKGQQIVSTLPGNKTVGFIEL